MPVLAFDVVVKYAAATAGFATCWKLRAGHPVLRAYFTAFFATLSLSLFIGATLIVANHGVDGAGAPSLARTVLALTMAASGMCSLVVGAAVHALRHAGIIDAFNEIPEFKRFVGYYRLVQTPPDRLMGGCALTPALSGE